MDEPANKDLENRFTYHSPKPGQPEKYVKLRDAGKELGYLIKELAPVSREQSLALTKLEEAIMWANAAMGQAKGWKILESLDKAEDRNEYKTKQTEMSNVRGVPRP